MYTVTPVTESLVYVDQMSGSTDREKIDEALLIVQNPNSQYYLAPVVFGAKSYNYGSGSVTFNVHMTFRGSQPQYADYIKPSTSNSRVRVTGNWTFNAGASFEGIWFDAQRSPLIPFRFYGGSFYALRSYFSGARSTQANALARVIHVNPVASNIPEIRLIQSKIFDSHSTRNIDEGNNAVSCRGFDCSNSFSGLLHLEDCELFDIGMDVVWSNGQKFIDNPTFASTAWDVDIIDLSGNGSSTRKNVFINVLLHSCPGSYVKNSYGGRRMEFDNVTYHIREGHAQRGQVSRWQNGNGASGIIHYSGFIRNSVMKIEGTRLGNSQREDSLLFAFEGCLGIGIEDNFVSLDNISYVRGGAMNSDVLFGTQRARNGTVNLEIKNSVVDSRLRGFFGHHRNVHSSLSAAMDRRTRLRLENNVGLYLGRRFMHERPFIMNDCDGYMYMDLQIVGTNTFADNPTKASRTTQFNSSSIVKEASAVNDPTQNHIIILDINDYQTTCVNSNPITNLKVFNLI
jgi:hypothetical protein